MPINMGEQDFESYLLHLLREDQDGYEYYDEDGNADEDVVAEFGAVCPGEVDTFKDCGILTQNKGLVVTMDDGSEFQVTIVRSR